VVYPKRVSSHSFHLRAFVRWWITDGWAVGFTFVVAHDRVLSAPFPTRKARGCKCLEQVAAGLVAF
jgi:hypothetical protein